MISLPAPVSVHVAMAAMEARFCPAATHAELELFREVLERPNPVVFAENPRLQDSNDSWE